MTAAYKIVVEGCSHSLLDSLVCIVLTKFRHGSFDKSLYFKFGVLRSAQLKAFSRTSVVLQLNKGPILRSATERDEKKALHTAGFKPTTTGQITASR